MPFDIISLKNKIEVFDYKALYEIFMHRTDADVIEFLDNKLHLLESLAKRSGGATKDGAEDEAEKEARLHTDYVLCLMGFFKGDQSFQKALYRKGFSIDDGVLPIEWGMDKCDADTLEVFASQVARSDLDQWLQKHAKQYKRYRLQYFRHKSEGTLLSFVAQMIQHSNLRTVAGDRDGVAPLAFPALRECACPQYNRKTNGARSQVEGDVVAYAEGFDKEKQLSYLSFGCGSLLQDFVILLKLIQKGHRHFNVFLVDVVREDASSLKQFDFLREVVVDELGGSFEYRYLEGMSQFKKLCPNQKFDLAVSVDFDPQIIPHRIMQFFKDMRGVHESLSDQGRFFFTLKNMYLIFNQDKMLHSYFLPGHGCQWALVRHSDHLLCYLRGNHAQTINYLTFPLSYTELMLLIPLLAHSHATEIKLSFLGERNLSNENKGVLEYFYSLIMPEKKYP